MPRSPNRPRAALRFIVVATGVFAAASLWPGPASAQSFDCREARDRDELLICEQPGLARLDQQLATLYRQKIGDIPKEQQDAFHQHETNFLNARRQCGEHYHCIEQSYRNRIKELEDLASEEERERSSNVTPSADAQSERPIRPRDHRSTRSEPPPEPSGSSSAAANPTEAAEPQSTERSDALKKASRPAEHHAKPNRATTTTAADPQLSATPGGMTAEPAASDRQPAKSESPKPTIRWVDPAPAR
jgi:uncharacterized protein